MAGARSSPSLTRRSPELSAVARRALAIEKAEESRKVRSMRCWRPRRRRCAPAARIPQCRDRVSTRRSPMIESQLPRSTTSAPAPTPRKLGLWVLSLLAAVSPPPAGRRPVGAAGNRSHRGHAHRDPGRLESDGRPDVSGRDHQRRSGGVRGVAPDDADRHGPGRSGAAAAGLPMGGHRAHDRAWGVLRPHLWYRQVPWKASAVPSTGNSSRSPATNG